VGGHARALLQHWAFIATGTIWALDNARRADSVESHQDLLLWSVDRVQAQDTAALRAQHLWETIQPGQDVATGVEARAPADLEDQGP